ncbi:MAG: heme-binding protein [Marinobacterium sp.]|nr:heme-binding protein [Marinobacterium sp.]
MLKTETLLDWQRAACAAQAACDFAMTQQLTICVWVLDRHGNPLAMQRINNTPAYCTDIARNKAATAAAFGFATADWQQRLADKPALLDGLSKQPGLITFGGGLPIEYNGERIGAIGVSGASEAQDIACAEAGLNALDLN